MKNEKRFLKAVKGEKVDRPPFWFMRQAGRYLPEYQEIRKASHGFLDMCYSPDKATEVTLQPIRRFDMDAAILFSDILVVPDALGIKVDFVPGKGPVLEAHDTKETIISLAVTDVTKALSPVYEAVENIRMALPEDKTLIGFCGAPWTVATYIVEGGSSRDFMKTRTLALTDPETFSHLIEVLVEATAEHLMAQIKAGAEVVQVFDSWAGILAEGEFDRWCIAPIRSLIQKVKNHFPDIPIIVFPKGAGLRYHGFGKAVGADVVGVDQTVPLHAMQALAKETAVQGNLDNMLLAYDKAAAVKQTESILAAMDHLPFIFNLGHGVIPQTPLTHVEAVSETIKGWNG